MPEIARGLEDVLFTETKLTFIDGERGILRHVGIPIQELARHSSFEELSFLLLNVRLPVGDELAAFSAALAERRELPQGLLDLMASFPSGVHPMHALRTAVSALALFDPKADQTTEEGKQELALKLIARMATIVAALHRLRSGQKPVAPRADLSHAANFLYMMHAEEPSAEQARLLDIALILHADHGMNASTFTGISTASTLADMYSSITSAIGALKGPLHGGANEAVMDMLDEIGSPERAVRYITDKLDRKEKIMGVGHRVYKYFDPRSRVLKDYAEVVAQKHGKSERYQILETVERTVVDRLSVRGIYPNVDFYSGVVYSDLGIPKPFFTPVFAVARVSGWMASIIEYTRANRLLRPDALYTGPDETPWLPPEERLVPAT
ncbi:MAG TPA: citrate/2-methylcitrate synthase [Deinococcales bacterium]|nr:citrate/2-methylcitrate synthase [Deinococcales bacterium]